MLIDICIGNSTKQYKRHLGRKCMCSINGNNKLKLLFITDKKTMGSRRR